MVHVQVQMWIKNSKPSDIFLHGAEYVQILTNIQNVMKSYCVPIKWLIIVSENSDTLDPSYTNWTMLSRELCNFFY